MRKLVLFLTFAALTALPFTTQAGGGLLLLKSTVTDGDGTITLGDIFDYADDASGVVVAYRQGTTAVLDAAEVQMIAHKAGMYWNNPKGIRRIIVSQGADSAAPTRAPVTAAGATQTPPSAVKASEKTKEALVFTRSLNVGEVVQPSDIAFAPVQAHLVSGPVASNPQDIIGKSAKWPVREGAVVRISDLGNPVVVKKSQTIKVIWSAGGVNLAMTGLAQKDGAPGDVIPVLNTASKKLVDAVVTGPGTAAAGPGSASLRAANPQYYSSR